MPCLVLWLTKSLIKSHPPRVPRKHGNPSKHWWRYQSYETFDEFNAKLKDIVNPAFNLGEMILEPKIVRKILRFLPKWFHAKITAIEESKHKRHNFS